MTATRVEMGELALTQSTSTIVLVTMDTRATTAILVGLIQIVATVILLVSKYCKRIYAILDTRFI